MVAGTSQVFSMLFAIDSFLYRRFTACKYVIPAVCLIGADYL